MSERRNKAVKKEIPLRIYKNRKPFLGRFFYKILLDADVEFRRRKIIWKNKAEKEEIFDLREILKAKGFNKDKMFFYGPVIYCRTLDEAYKIRMFYDQFIKRIEIVENFETENLK